MKSIIRLSLFSLFVIAVIISGCSKEEPMVVVQSSTKQITSFVFLLSQNPVNTNVIGVIDEANKSITVTMPPGTIINALLPDIEISKGATISPNTTVQDFTTPLQYTVTAEDGSQASYTVTVITSLIEWQILQTILDANPGNTIAWNLSSTTDLSTLDGVKTNGQGTVIGLILEEKNISRLPPEIGLLTNLSELVLAKNNLTVLPPEIAQLLDLKILDLTQNRLSVLSPEIGLLVNLEKLDISRNLFETLPPEIGKLTRLIDFRLYSNALSSIPPEIGFLINLDDLNLLNNDLSTIPISLSYFSNRNIPLSRDENVTFTTSPTDMDILVSIYTANPNNLLTWGVDEFPEVEFTTDGQVKGITANDKNLRRIPKPISNLAALEVLNINNNPLGSIPSEIGDISTLTALTLFKTEINTVPAALGKLSKLTLLSLTGNPITSIPKSVCDLQIANGGILTILTDPGEGCP